MIKVNLNRIANKARQDKELKFTSLAHHANETNLVKCYRKLKQNRACGIDGETVQAYGNNLEERISQPITSQSR